MYKINKSTNRISRLATKRFSDLGFTERNHLQEWLANEPNALGEELLIIQKEFDGFDDTRERLDLLALDVDGNLVVIENKLDDTGRDVVWQAIKYVSYCSSLTKSQIVEIFQQYINRYESQAENHDASSRICEFLGKPDIEEVVLNSGNGQRLMFVAASYRKEVTSSSLWLLSHGIQVQCIKVTPYSMDEELFLNVEQIIPTPEARDLMIGISTKEAEEKSTEVKLKNRHKIRLAFWEQALESFRNSDCQLFKNISPSKDHWLSAGSGVSSCPFNLIFGTKEARVEIGLSRSNTDENKFLFDRLYADEDEIEKKFGATLEWLRLDHRKASRIQFSKKFEGYNEENWPEIIEWMIDNMTRFEIVMKDKLSKAQDNLKSIINDPEGTHMFTVNQKRNTRIE